MHATSALAATPDDGKSPLAAADRLVFREYHALLEYKLHRRDELDREIARLAELPILAPMVRRLQCFRGIALQGAMVLATEIVDWRRFERPTQLAAYLGLVSREDSSGDRERKGSITKPATVTVDTCSSKRRGAIITGQRSAWISSGDRRDSRRR